MIIIANDTPDIVPTTRRKDAYPAEAGTELKNALNTESGFQ
jgi:hypothetical protein